jgi:hypothetical protein
LATFRSKLPTKRESVLLFAACAFLVYGWTIVVYFWEVPGWQKYLGAWEIATILAYALTSALVESLVLSSVFIVLRVVLPTPVFRDRFVAKAATMVLMNALWAILLHLMILSDQILTWTLGRYFLCAVVYLLSLVFSWLFVHLSEFFAARIEAVVDRVTALLYFYVPLSVFGILVVVGRTIL